MLRVPEHRFFDFLGIVPLFQLIQTVRSAEASWCPPRMFRILFRL